MRRLIAALLALAALAVLPARADAALAKGMDISHWQGAIDWFQVAGGGYSFVFVKATEGTSIVDPTYGVNRSGAASIGLRSGAYHFARPGGSGEAGLTANAIAQADRFVDVSQLRPGDLPPVLDLESRGGLSTADLTLWTDAWLDQVERRLGVKSVVYASPNFWKTSVGDTTSFAAAGIRLWVAHWTKSDSPLVPGGNWGGQGWTFWQWTDCATIPGFARCLDGDRFNGTNPATVAIPALRPSTPTAVEVPTVLGSPQAGKLLAAVPGRWNGGRPLAFAYQWSSCDAAGAGCVPIAGATAETYTPTAADAGHALIATVSASNSAGTTSAASPPTLAVASTGGTATAPVATTLPSVVGTPQAGQTLTASVGTWTGSPTAFAFQWRRCTTACATIDGAAAAQYVVAPEDIGATLSVVVTATGRGGSRSAVSPATAAVAAAPIPAAVVGSAVSTGAGAVTTADHAVTVTWQPGAVPGGATVSVAPVPAKLPLPATAFAVGVTAPLAWPVDVAYAAAPQDAVVGRLGGSGGVWQSVPALPAASLPEAQVAGAYRDAAGLLHVLTRAPGQVALFAPGAWGDPRFVPTVRPTVQRLTGSTALVARRAPDGSRLVLTRVIVNDQARLQVSLRTRGRQIAKAEAQVLRSGSLPIRVRFHGARGGYSLVVRTVDPYGRKATLTIPVRVP